MREMEVVEHSLVRLGPAGQACVVDDGVFTVAGQQAVAARVQTQGGPDRLGLHQRGVGHAVRRGEILKQTAK